MKTNKGNVMILILAAVVVVGVGYWYVTNQQTATSEPEPTPTVTPTETTIDTSDWKTYTNEELGISFKYPKNWFVWRVGKNKLITVSNIREEDKESNTDYGEGAGISSTNLYDSVSIVRKKNSVVASIEGPGILYEDLLKTNDKIMYVPSVFGEKGLVIKKLSTQNVQLEGQLISVRSGPDAHFTTPEVFRYFLPTGKDMISATVSDPGNAILLYIIASLK